MAERAEAGTGTAPSGPRVDAFWESHGLTPQERQCVLLAAKILCEDGLQGYSVVCGTRRACRINLHAPDPSWPQRRGSHAIELNGLSSRFGLSCYLQDVFELTLVTPIRGRLLTCGVKAKSGPSFSFICWDVEGARQGNDSVTKASALALALYGNLRVCYSSGAARGVSCVFEVPSGPPPPYDPWVIPEVPSEPGDTGLALAAANIRLTNAAAPPPPDPEDFATFLAPTGLQALYLTAFNESGLEYKDLPCLEREDLRELLGITNRLHQIKIMSQIRTCFGPDWGWRGSPNSPRGSRKIAAGGDRTVTTSATMEVEGYSASSGGMSGGSGCGGVGPLEPVVAVEVRDVRGFPTCRVVDATPANGVVHNGITEGREMARRGPTP